MNSLAENCGGILRESPSKGSMAIAFLLAMTVSASGFDCVVATSFDKDFPDKWTHSSSKASPYLSNRDTVYAGIPWRIHVLFKNYSRDYYGNVDISFSYKIMKPNGTLFYDTTGIQAVSGLIANPNTAANGFLAHPPRKAYGPPALERTVSGDTGLLLSYCIPVVLFSRKDMPGKYKIIVTAEDGITNAKKTKEKTIVFSNYPKTTSGTFTDISFNVWVHSYCLDPDPGRAISAFSYFIGSKMSDNDAIFWPVFYFFQCLFGDNPALIQMLAGAIPKSSTRLQEYTVFLLRAIRIKKSDIEYPIPDSLWKKFDKVAATGYYDPFADAFTIKSNRLIESGFYYYGKYSMVRFLIECLGVTTPAGYDAFLKNCKAYCDDCPKILDKETSLQFRSDARKILEKTYSKHPLVNAYCNYALQNDRLEADARKALKDIIASSMK
jgi:hypothetical protein